MIILYAMDFKYDGEYLRNYGFIICRIGNGSDLQTISLGADLELNTVPNLHGTKHSLVGSKYNDCYTTTFQICKNPDLYNDLSIDEYSLAKITRWLNRGEFKEFCFLTESGETVGNCYMSATFNVRKLMDDNGTYGLELEVLTDSPFGRGDTELYVYNITTPNQVISVVDNSDEIGYSYPSLEIDINSAGELKMSNDMTGDVLSIKNCQVGEKITFSGESQIVSSSLASHKISKDFNFNFLKLGNTYEENINNITVSLPCTITLQTRPIIKNMPM